MLLAALGELGQVAAVGGVVSVITLLVEVVRGILNGRRDDRLKREQLARDDRLSEEQRLRDERLAERTETVAKKLVTEAATVAEGTKLVKETLVATQTATDKKLDAHSEKLNVVAETGEKNHVLLNSQHGILLRSYMLSTRLNAERSGDVRERAIAELAEQAWVDHDAQQKKTDKLIVRQEAIVHHVAASAESAAESAESAEDAAKSAVSAADSAASIADKKVIDAQ